MAKKKEAATPKEGTQYNVGALYEKKGEKLEQKNKTCPKCGPGVFMAKHSDRLTCGKCSYTEFTGKK